MDQFGNLSLDDGFERTIRDEDIIGISNLSISDNVHKIPVQVLNRYMPHFPISPSPLRNSLTFVEPFGDEMDIDEFEEDVGVRDILNENVLQEELISKKTPEVTFLVPEHGYEPQSLKREQLKAKQLKAKRNEGLIEDQMVHKDVKAKSQEQEGDSPNSAAVLKALLSPTSLGVAAAAKIDGISLPSQITLKDEATQDEGIEEIKDSVSEGLAIDDMKEHLRSRSKLHPIHVSINNHHYYYPESERYFSSAKPLIYQDDRYNMEEPMMHRDVRYQLPLPWSSKSRPVSRGSYAFMSYLQLFLNCITVTATFSFITSLIRTVKTDIKSTWEHRKLELDFQSSRCKVQYLTNKCDIQGRPALQEQCQRWEQCMNRNNDIFFRARSTLSAKLFGEIINSFIEPIGWKALLVILMGLVVWCFCSNFLLGFARAKSYYGDAAQQTLLHQRKQLFLGEDDDMKGRSKGKSLKDH